MKIITIFGVDFLSFSLDPCPEIEAMIKQDRNIRSDFIGDVMAIVI